MFNYLEDILVGGLEHDFVFHSVGNVILSQLTNSYFQRGRYTTNQISDIGMTIDDYDIIAQFPSYIAEC